MARRRARDHLLRQAQIAGDPGAALAPHDLLAHPGKVALRGIRVPAKQLLGDRKGDDGVAEEFQTFVRCDAGARPRTVGERLLAPLGGESFDEPEETAGREGPQRSGC